MGRPHPSEGEALVASFGVQTAAQQGWRRVIIETDCLPVHRYLSHHSSPLVSFGAILDFCFEAKASFDSLSFAFVKRSGNSYAHSIATDSNLLWSEGAFYYTFNGMIFPFGLKKRYKII